MKRSTYWAILWIAAIALLVTYGSAQAENPSWYPTLTHTVAPATASPGDTVTFTVKVTLGSDGSLTNSASLGYKDAGGTDHQIASQDATVNVGHLGATAPLIVDYLANAALSNITCALTKFDGTHTTPTVAAGQHSNLDFGMGAAGAIGTATIGAKVTW